MDVTNLEKFKNDFNLNISIEKEEEVELSIEVEDQHVYVSKEVDVEVSEDYDWDQMKDLITEDVHINEYLMLTAALSEWITELQMTHHIVKFEANDQTIMNLEARLKEQTASFTKTQGQLLDLRQAIVGTAAAGIRTHEEVLEVAKQNSEFLETTIGVRHVGTNKTNA